MRDEKKAKKDNNLLFEVILLFLKKEMLPYTQEVFYMTDLIGKNIPTSFILGIVSLLYEPISIKSREVIFQKLQDGKTKQEDILFQNEWFLEFLKQNPLEKSAQKYSKTSETILFNDVQLDESLKQRINEWVNDMVFVFFSDASIIMLQKLQNILGKEIDIFDEDGEEEEEKKKQENERRMSLKIIQKTLEHTFFLFLQEQNILITPSKAQAYASFIFIQVKKNILQIQTEEI